MWAIVRFASDKSIHTFTIENAYDAHKLLTMDNVVWIQVITDTGMILRPKEDNQAKLDIMSWSRPLRPNGAWMPVSHQIDEMGYKEAKRLMTG